MAASYPDHLLRVNLSTETIDEQRIPSSWIRDFIGGKGIGIRYLYDAVGPQVDPLSSNNVLLLLIGPLSGYLPGDAQFCAITKSPLTGLFLDSYAGGSFVPSFRRSFPNSLGIVIEGSRSALQTLDLRDGTPTLRDATFLSDATVEDVAAAYPEDSVVSVGPAGESGVSFASIAVDGGAHHAGRGGAGAVMGTKGLKAIVLDHTADIDPPTPTLRSLKADLESQIANSAYGASYLASGTLETIDIANELAILPSYGWQEQQFDQTAGIGIEAVKHSAGSRERPDDSIPGDFSVTIDGTETVLRGGTPLAMGANLGIGSFDAVAELGAICDRLGLDIISAGNALSLAILAAQHDRIDRNLEFGDPEPFGELLTEIAMQSTPLGRTLAQGVASAATKFGLAEIVPTVKAMEVPSFDPRGAPALALAYATSDRGACHRRAIPLTAELYTGSWTPTQTARLTILEQNRRALYWSFILDDVLIPGFGDIGAEWLHAVGLDVSKEQLARAGVRIWTMTRLFNVREGITPTDDALSARFATGDSAPDPATFDRLKKQYYELREWDQHGVPSRRLLDRLGLLPVLDKQTPIGSSPV